MAATEFVALSFATAARHPDPAALGMLVAPAFMLMKGVVLLLAGVAAGFVGAQLRRRIAGAYRALQERQSIVNMFAQQVSPAIVDELLRQGPDVPGRKAFVCVMFMDIRDFTRMVEPRAPEEIVALQNAVFGAAVDVVNRHRGVINQFLGDGFMATFGAPLATGSECRDAVAAARDLVAEVKALVEAGRIPPLSAGIGLHAGEAVTGNVGSALRKQYSVTGNVVILASRIEQLNKVYASQILASAEVVRAAGDAAAGAAPLGTVRVKGREAPVELYRLA